MSAAGILASNLFSNAISHAAQGAQSLASRLDSDAKDTFAAVQQKLSALNSSSMTGASSLPANLAQLGQDLKAGNLAAAQTDFSQLQAGTSLGLAAQLNFLLRPTSGASGSQAGSPLPPNQSGAIADQMTMAMKVYGALQQSLTNSSQSTSQSTPLTA